MKEGLPVVSTTSRRPFSSQKVMVGSNIVPVEMVENSIMEQQDMTLAVGVFVSSCCAVSYSFSTTKIIPVQMLCCCTSIDFSVICTISFSDDFILLLPMFVHKYLCFLPPTLEKHACYFCIKCLKHKNSVQSNSLIFIIAWSGATWMTLLCVQYKGGSYFRGRPF